MTKINPGQSLKRETAVLHRGRPLVIELHARHLEIRVKGERDGFTVDYGAIFDLARKLAFRVKSRR